MADLGKLANETIGWIASAGFKMEFTEFEIRFLEIFQCEKHLEDGIHVASIFYSKMSKNFKKNKKFNNFKQIGNFQTNWKFSNKLKKKIFFEKYLRVS